jgi:peptidoglycan/LPS O-acetylase OafA/YrhL
VDLGHLAAWLGFLNDWHPALTVDALGAWSVVPGGWSISAEFSFYLVFPYVATLATSQRRAFILFVAVCLATAAVDTVGQYLMLNRYDSNSIGNFMYFWAPNQAPVFALGILLYFVLKTLKSQRMRSVRERFPAGTAVLGIVGLLIFASTAFLGLPKALTFNDFRPPALMQASLGFALIIIALAQAQPGLFVNRWIAFVGKVSFSAYLIHFSVIELINGPLASFAGRDEHDYAAIGAFALGWLAVVAATIIFSTFTYHLIEDPGIKLGRRVIAMQRGLRRASRSTSV